MSLTRTVDELGEAVLRELGVIDAAETPDSDDLDYIEERYIEKFHALASHGLDLTYWTSTSIPVAVFLIMRDLMMNEVRGAFGEPMTPEEKEGREIVILKALRRHISRPKSGHAIVGEYF